MKQICDSSLWIRKLNSGGKRERYHENLHVPTLVAWVPSFFTFFLFPFLILMQPHITLFLFFFSSVVVLWYTYWLLIISCIFFSCMMNKQTSKLQAAFNLLQTPLCTRYEIHSALHSKASPWWEKSWDSKYSFKLDMPLHFPYLSANYDASH